MAKAKLPPPAAVTAAPVPPPAPPKPNWPVNQPPNPATVRWDSRGLEIEASNSSLDQILHEVATDTGAKLQGMSEDQRVFGIYGPGPARDVLSKLLDGSGYNVMMVGGQGDAPPQQIILSRSLAGTPVPVNATQALRNNNGDEESDNQEQQPEPQQPPEQFQQPPIRNPFGGGPPRTPQEVQQEMLMRQRQMQQQQEQQQQNNPQ